MNSTITDINPNYAPKVDSLLLRRPNLGGGNVPSPV